jgi:3-oxoacyl-[acyl-carrier-protein] synthase II
MSEYRSDSILPRGSAVPISGMGCLTAAGSNLSENLASLFAGRRCPSPSRRVRSSHAVRYPVFEVPSHVLPPAYAKEHEGFRSAGFALVAAREALADAGLDPESLRDKRVGVCIGTTVGSAMNDEEFYRALRSGRQPGMAPITAYLRANPSSVVRREFSLCGPCQTVTTACSSGTVAIGEAAAWIRAGVCDIALAGGADGLCRVVYNGFISLLITDDKPVRPFDEARKGLNLGEGAGVVVLESSASLEARGGEAKGHLRGYGNACDAHHVSAPHPDGVGLRQSISDALGQAGIEASELAFINAHGTGTPDNDRVEGRLYPEFLPGVPFLSTKGLTGHTLGAAGAIEAVLSLACLRERRLPASLGFERRDPEFPGVPTREAASIEGSYALSTSLAFGGNNAAVVLRGEEL